MAINILEAVRTRNGRPIACALILMMVSVDAASAFTMPAWSDIFNSLKPFKDNPSWEETLGEGGEFDELNLMEEEGEARYGLVQLGSGTGTAYNVTLNLSGHILMAIGISIYLLMYMWIKAMSGYSSGGYGHYDKRRSFREKRSLEEEEKEAIEMLYRIISSLNEEQVEDLLTQFEKQIFIQAKAKGELYDIENIGEDCVNKLICQMFVTNSPINSPLLESSKKLRVMNLLREAMDSKGVAKDTVKTLSDQNVVSLDSYSIYDWNDLIKLILGRQTNANANQQIKEEKSMMRHKAEYNGSVMKMFKKMHNNLNKIPSKLSNYVQVRNFATSLKQSYSSASEYDLRDHCKSRYSSCKLATLQMP